MIEEGIKKHLLEENGKTSLIPLKKLPGPP